MVFEAKKEIPVKVTMSIAKPLYFRSLSRTSILMAAGIFIGMTAPHNLSSQTTYAYVANSSDASISVIDTSTHAVVRTLKGGGLRPGLTADALNGKANLLLVTNQSSNTITPISTSGKLFPDIVVGNGPAGVVFGASGEFAYVTLSRDHAVVVIDVPAKSVAARVPVEQAPMRVAIEPYSGFAVVTDKDSSAISIIDTITNQLVKTISVGVNPVGLAFTPAGALYVCDANYNMVEEVNTRTGATVAWIPVGTTPVGIAINPAGTLAIVVNQSSSTVSIIDIATNTVTKTLSGDFSAPSWVAFTPSGTEAYVTNNGNNTVAVIETASQTVSTIIPVGGRPSGIAIGTKQ